MQAHSRGVLALAFVACVSCGGGPTTPTGATTNGAGVAPAPIAASEAFPARAPFLTPGEVMSYRLSMHGVDVASFSMAVGELTELAGRRVVVVQSGVAASPLVAMVKKVEDNFTSWIDVETSRTVMFRAAELAHPDDPVQEWTDAEASAVTAGAFPVKVKRADTSDEKVEMQIVGDAPVFDINSFLMVLRTWDVPQGTKASADVIRSKLSWRTTVTMKGYETLTTALGDFSAVRIDGESTRLKRNGNLDPESDTRHYSIWISDDADRVPLAMVARTDYGDLRMDIVSYQPGTGARLGE